MDALDKAVEAAMAAEPQLVEAWKEMSKYLSLIRNMRNASEHPQERQGVSVTDFSMRADGRVYPPLVEIQHAQTPIRTLPLVELLEFVRRSMLEHAEVMLTSIRSAALLKDNPFREWVAEFPEGVRRHKVRPLLSRRSIERGLAHPGLAA